MSLGRLREWLYPCDYCVNGCISEFVTYSASPCGVIFRCEKYLSVETLPEAAARICRKAIEEEQG